MRFFIVAHILTGICFTCVFWVSTSGNPHPQYYENPKLFYKPMTMEHKLAGGFNISICMEELMTCWEVVRSELWCHDEFRYETICPFMKEYCHDFFGNYPSEIDNQRFRMFETECPWQDDDWMT